MCWVVFFRNHWLLKCCGQLFLTDFNTNTAIADKAAGAIEHWLTTDAELLLGAIGINGMGWSNVKAALKVPGVNLVAVCDIDKNAIEVNTEDYSTNIEGVYAIGDINTYKNKLKLILCGFHEAALMTHSAYKYINPGVKYTMKYTTVNGVNEF